MDGPDLQIRWSGSGLIVHGLEPAQRRQAYLADITYGTNNEFGFDYLRTTWCFTRNILCSAP